MTVSINSFTANTTIQSSKVNENFTNLKSAVDQLQDDKVLNSNSDGETITFNIDTSKIHTVTLGGNRTLAVTQDTVGYAFVIRLKQDGTGSRTVTWWAGISWPGGSAPTLSTSASAIDAFGFVKTAAGAYDGYFLGFDLS